MKLGAIPVPQVITILPRKFGDEDIGPPDPKLAAELGLPAKPNTKGGGNVFSAFAKFGKFFWQQMTRIH